MILLLGPRMRLPSEESQGLVTRQRTSSPSPACWSACPASLPSRCWLWLVAAWCSSRCTSSPCWCLSGPVSTSSWQCVTSDSPPCLAECAAPSCWSPCWPVPATVSRQPPPSCTCSRLSCPPYPGSSLHILITLQHSSHSTPVSTVSLLRKHSGTRT